MVRRADPERLATAHRAGLRNRLIGDHHGPDRVDAWIALFEATERSERRDHGAFWQSAYD